MIINSHSGLHLLPYIHVEYKIHNFFLIEVHV